MTTCLDDTAFATLQALCQAHALSGHEADLGAQIAERIEPWADEVRADALGNVIALQKGNGRRRVMVTAHLDEIGLMVRGIDARGYLFVAPIGGNRAQNLFARACTVRTEGNRLIPGVVNHPRPGRPEAVAAIPEIDEFFIDVGAASAEHAAAMGIEIGNTVAIDYPFRRLGDHRIAGTALDNRALAFLQIEAMKTLHDSEQERPDIYFVFTTLEEVGCRGAKTAAYAIDPDLAIALDITVANDLPGTTSDHTITELDQGPAIKVMDRLSNAALGLIAAPEIVRGLKQVARARDIPYQLEVFMAGSTDAATIHTERAGIPSGALLLPTRYVHAHEVASERDMLQLKALLVHYLRSLTGSPA